MQMHEMNKANFPMDPKHMQHCEQERKRSYIQSVKETKQSRIHSKTQKQTSITIKPNHEPRMVETSQGCKAYSNSQVFRFVFTLKSTS